LQSTSSVPYLKPIAIFACGCYQELHASCLDGFIQQINSIVEGISGFVIPLEFSFQSDQLTHFDGITLLECLQVSDFKEKPMLVYSWLTIETILRIRPSSALIAGNTFFKQMPFPLPEYMPKFLRLKPDEQTQTSMAFSDLTSTYHDMANDYYGAYRLWLGFKHAISIHAQSFMSDADALQSSQMERWWANKAEHFNSLPYKSQQAKLQSLPITRPQYPDYFDKPQMLLGQHVKTGLDKKLRILYIDDEYHKGYSDVLRSMFFFKELFNQQLTNICPDSAPETGDIWGQTTADGDKNIRFVACSNVETAKHWLKDWGVLKLNPVEQKQSLNDFMTRLAFFLNQTPQQQAKLILQLDPDSKNQSQALILYKEIKISKQKERDKSLVLNIINQIKAKDVDGTIKFLEKISLASNKVSLLDFKKILPKNQNIDDKLILKYAKLLKSAIEEERCCYRSENIAKYLNCQQFLEAEKKLCHPPYTTVIFLDLKLEPHRDTGKDIRQYASIQLLESISKESPNTPVILFTASRQVLNYLQIFDSSKYRIKGWFVKEAPDMPESPENSMYSMYYLLHKIGDEKQHPHYKSFLTKNSEQIEHGKISLYALIDLYSDAILFHPSSGLLFSDQKNPDTLARYIKAFLDKQKLKKLDLPSLEDNGIENGTRTYFTKLINRTICFSLCLFHFKPNDKKWNTEGLEKYFSACNLKQPNHLLTHFIDSTNDLLGAYGIPATFHEIIYEHERRYFKKLFENPTFMTHWQKHHHLTEESATERKQDVLSLLSP